MHEIEDLWLAMIASASTAVYIESQYFANRRIAEAIAARLGEADGPEFVVVNPETADGWLEEKAMGTARAKLLEPGSARPTCTTGSGSTSRSPPAGRRSTCTPRCWWSTTGCCGSARRT